VSIGEDFLDGCVNMPAQRRAALLNLERRAR
jgi:hypothetical protein